jgi:pre-mRNA-processing factor SLU7
MRELPDGTKGTEDPKLQNGKQEFHRPSGDAVKFEKLQKFAWQSERAGGDIHLQANPTMGELLHKRVVEEADKKRSAERSGVLDKYGGAEYLAAPPKELLQSTEQFIVYTKLGEVINGAEAPATKSRYAEDGKCPLKITLLISVYVNNHTSVYGSWFRDGRWGYVCCHQFYKNSYCTGATGVEADLTAARLAKGEIDDMPPPSLPKKQEPIKVNGEQIRDAIKGQTKRKRPEDVNFQLDKRTMTAAENAMMSEEEYEDYRRNKMARSDDPLLAMQALEGAV